MTAAEALASAARRLRAAGVPEAGRDARRLLAHVLGAPPDRMTLILREPLPDTALAPFEMAVSQRAARVPVAQIVGGREFYGRRFEVTQDVLDPRPETETLVEAALKAPFGTVLDLGTGSGCILLTCLLETSAHGLGVDISQEALSVATRNAARLGLGDRARLAVSNWFDAVEGRFDLIVSNPPYLTGTELAQGGPELAHEPRIALTPGGDGLDAYRRIAAGAGCHLRGDGRLLVEVGASQATQVEAIFVGAGMSCVRRHKDLDGRDRVVEARVMAAH